MRISENVDMTEKYEVNDQEYAFQVALFTVSSAMVGVCLTAIGLILVVERTSEYRTLCDALPGIALDYK